MGLSGTPECGEGDAGGLATRRARVSMLLDSNRPRDALKEAHWLLAHDPRDFETLGLMARAHLDLNDYPETERIGREMVVLRPNDEWGHRILALTWTRQRLYDRAVPAAREAARLAPNTLLVVGALVEAERLAHDYDAARQHAQELLRLGPDSAYAHCVVGLLMRDTHEFQRAIDHHLKAISLEPAHARWHLNLGTCYEQAGKRHAAVESYRRALELDPTSAEAAGKLRRMAARDRLPVDWDRAFLYVVAQMLVAPWVSSYRRLSWYRGLPASARARYFSWRWLLACVGLTILGVAILVGLTLLCIVLTKARLRMGS